MKLEGNPNINPYNLEGDPKVKKYLAEKEVEQHAEYGSLSLNETLKRIREKKEMHANRMQENVEKTGEAKEEGRALALKSLKEAEFAFRSAALSGNKESERIWYDNLKQQVEDYQKEYGDYKFQLSGKNLDEYVHELHDELHGPQTNEPVEENERESLVA